MVRVNKSDRRLPFPITELVYALGPALGIGLFLLTPKAYWTRIRDGRGLFASTLYERRRTLPKACLEGRVLLCEPYLRPTADCNCHASEVIAMADKLREGSASDWQYAEAVYDFARNDIAYAMEPVPRRGVVGTLATGCGICLDKLHLFVALARAGGLPARYCSVGHLRPLELGPERPRLQTAMRHLATIEAEPNWSLKTLAASLRRLLKQLETAVAAGESFEMRHHLMGEVKIGDFWIPADPSWSDEQAVAAQLPLPRFGYDPLTLRALKGSIIGRNEEFAMGKSYWVLRLLACVLGRGLVDHINLTLDKDRANGRQHLAEVGREAYIRRLQRFYVPVPGAAQVGLPILA